MRNDEHPLWAAAGARMLDDGLPGWDGPIVEGEILPSVRDTWERVISETYGDTPVPPPCTIDGPLTGPREHYAMVIITDTDAFAIITDDGEGIGDLFAAFGHMLPYLDL